MVCDLTKGCRWVILRTACIGGEITNGAVMVGDITKLDRTPLLPLRHAQGDFFVCDIFDAAPKGDMASMAHLRLAEPMSSPVERLGKIDCTRRSMDPHCPHQTRYTPSRKNLKMFD
jgi:hypothetical protein